MDVLKNRHRTLDIIRLEFGPNYTRSGEFPRGHSQYDGDDDDRGLSSRRVAECSVSVEIARCAPRRDIKTLPRRRRGCVEGRGGYKCRKFPGDNN